jgi:membrane-associated protease RseP (regulator of RpoE activity)
MKQDIPVRKFECTNCKHSDYRMSAVEVGEIAGRCPKCNGEMKVVGDEAPKWLSELLTQTSKQFEIEDFVAAQEKAEFEATARDSKRSFKAFSNALKRRGYIPVMRGSGSSLRIIVLKHPGLKPSRVWINVLLLIATFLTTFLAGYYLLPFGSDIASALMFSISIMLLLGAHELGHVIAAMENGVNVSMPYFIPAPSYLGTFGAVINVKEPIPSRNALVEMGAAGPLVGFALAIPLTFIGLLRSTPDPSGLSGLSLPFAPAAFVILQVGAFGYAPAVMQIHPLAFAGWVAMLLTLFNLLPAGQLDGGHITRAVLNGEKHYAVTRTLGFALLMSGLFFLESPLWIWGFLILFLFRTPHAGPLDDVTKLSSGRKKLALASLVVFLLCLPIPLG